jgi:flagellar hook protein FlgE
MSFQQGLSGLNATAKSLEVIGNNIANANTFGAKAARAEFADVYAASLNGTGNGASGSGIGVTLAAVAQQFTQGNITSTENTMDLAINGRGFFMFQDQTGREVYGRNGQLKLDRDGFVVNTQGARLLGKRWDESVNRAEGEPTAVSLPQGGGYAIKTGQGSVDALRGIRMSLNFDAGAEIIPAAVPRVQFNNPATYNFSTSQTVFDGQGLPLTITYYYQKNDINKWSVFGAIDGVPFNQANGVPYDPTVDDPDPIIQLEFGTDGKLLPTSATETTIDINDPRVPAADPLLFDDLPFKTVNVTQFGAPFAMNELKQDGYAFGKLTGITFDGDGIVKATYSNGRYLNLFQLQLADFPNLQGLRPLGGNMWESTFESGNKTVNPPGTGSAGAVLSGALEESNIDLTAELVSMITAQRVYQANAQSIKTIDQVMQTLVNLR